jgi:replication initiation and membrane attachment protein
MADLIYDNFKILNKYQLNAEDYRSLTLLYLPLLGIDSYATYSVLMSLDNDEICNFKKLLDLLNFHSLNTLKNAINKLEGMGLLKSFYSETKGYLYETIPPLNQMMFFDNEVLSSLLETQIGEVELKKLFTKNRTRNIGYKNITKKFNEVFETSSKSITNTMSKFFDQGIVVENKDFNYSLFRILFDSSVLSEDVLNDPKFKSRIERISYLYKLQEDEIHDVIIKTIDIDHNLEYASISKNARYAFQNKYKANNPRIESIVEDKFLPSVKDDAWRDVLNLVENLEIVDVLESISGIKPAVSEVKMFEELLNNTHFSTGVINLMILYVNTEKKGELPGYNYFEKIANTWARAKIKTPYDVLKYLESRTNQETKPKDNYKTPYKKVKPLPDWYDEYTKNLGNKSQEEQLNNDEKEELLNIVKDMFG